MSYKGMSDLSPERRAEAERIMSTADNIGRDVYCCKACGSYTKHFTHVCWRCRPE